MWKFNNKGLYTVKSAYRYTMETLIDNEELRVHGEWSRIWSMCVPQRVKVVVWRMLNGCLPRCMRLQDKGVDCSNNCPYCENHYENEWNFFV